jgi:hypothetical protein
MEPICPLVLDQDIRGMTMLSNLELLSKDEHAALKAVAIGPPSRAIQGELQTRLLQLGYVEEVLGNLVITDEGTKLVTLRK